MMTKGEGPVHAWIPLPLSHHPIRAHYYADHAPWFPRGSRAEPTTRGVCLLSDSPRDSDPPDPLSDEALLAQCRVETFRAGGPGGQHQNTTDSAVRLIHLPSGIRATSRVHRSQWRNRQEALRKLRERLEEARRPAKPRIPTRVPAREKRARLEAKRRRSRKKRTRKPPSEED